LSNTVDDDVDLVFVEYVANEGASQVMGPLTLQSAIAVA